MLCGNINLTFSDAEVTKFEKRKDKYGGDRTNSSRNTNPNAGSAIASSTMDSNMSSPTLQGFFGDRGTIGLPKV